MDYLEGQIFEKYSAHNLRRLSGELPEKESSKAVRDLLIGNIAKGSKILEVGSSSGHLIRTLAPLNLELEYTGVDIDEYAINRGQEYISQNSIPGISQANLMLGAAENLPFESGAFDISISLNVLEHLKEPRKAISELLRCSKHLILIRTMVSDQTFIVQEVRNLNHSNLGYQHLKLPAPIDEIDDQGKPMVGIYQNVYGKEFIEETLKRTFNIKKFKIFEDKMFSREAFDYDNSLSSLPRITQIIDGKQVRGLFIDTNHWIIIQK